MAIGVWAIPTLPNVARVDTTTVFTGNNFAEDFFNPSFVILLFVLLMQVIMSSEGISANVIQGMSPSQNSGFI